MAIRKDRIDRYSLMAPGNSSDEVTGEVYPDVLTSKYQDFEFSTLPLKIALEPLLVIKPYEIPKKYYGNYRGDDILLDLNLVPHIKYLEPGLAMYIPSGEDFSAFIKTRAVASRKKL